MMRDVIDEERARAIADEAVRRLATTIGLDDLVICGVEEFPVGWVFFYCRQPLLETQDHLRYGLAGNAPFLIDRRTGTAHVTGTAYQAAYYAAEFEAGR